MHERTSIASWRSRRTYRVSCVSDCNSFSFDNCKSHVYGIDDFVGALEGVKLKDYKTGNDIGLTLFRYGGFYWKFIVNEDWKTLDSKSTLRKGLKTDCKSDRVLRKPIRE